MRGWFDRSLVPASLFDSNLQPATWFDESLLRPSGLTPSSATLLAGTDGIYVGYVRVGSSLLTAFGSLSSEPLAGKVVEFLVTGPDGDDGIAFVGDQSTTLISIIYIDGFAWTVGVGTYDVVADATVYPLTNSEPDFILSDSYSVSTTSPGANNYNKFMNVAPETVFAFDANLAKTISASSTRSATILKSNLRQIADTTAPVALRLAALTRSIARTASATATLLRLKNFNKSIAALASRVATSVEIPTKSLLSLANVVDTLRKNTARAITNASAPASTLSATKSFFRSVLSQSSAVASLNALKGFLRTLASASTASATLVKESGKNLQSARTSVAAASKSLGRALQAIATMVASAATTYISGSNAFDQAVNAIVSASSTARRSMVRTISATSTTADTLLKSALKNILDTASGSASFSRIPTIIRSFTALSGSSATMVTLKSLLKSIQAAATRATSLTKSSLKIATSTGSGVATDLLSLVKFVLVARPVVALLNTGIPKRVATLAAASSSLTKSLLVSIAETVSVSATLLKGAPARLIATSSAVSSLLRPATKSLLKAISSVAFLNTGIPKRIAALADTSRTMTKAMSRSISDTASASATLLKGASSRIFATTSAVSLVLRRITENALATASAVATRASIGVRIIVANSLANVLTSLSAIYDPGTVAQAVNAIASGAATAQRSTGKAVSRLVNTARTIIKAMSEVAQVATAASPSMVKLPLKSLLKTVSPVVSAVKSTARSIARTVTSLPSVAFQRLTLRAVSALSGAQALAGKTFGKAAQRAVVASATMRRDSAKVLGILSYPEPRASKGSVKAITKAVAAQAIISTMKMALRALQASTGLIATVSRGFGYVAQAQSTTQVSAGLFHNVYVIVNRIVFRVLS